jgi:hypothetical protein
MSEEQTRKIRRLFPKESAEKPWTKKKHYKNWVNRLSRKKAEPRRSKYEDLCVGKESICKGDLGIPRKYMPQFTTANDVKRFQKFVKKAYGIKTLRSTRKAKQLRPSQNEISRKRVNQLIRDPNDSIFTKLTVPLVISKDNYVVDGHHRWAAYRMEKPDKPLPVVVIDTPIKDVLGIAIAWGAKHEEF